MIKTGVVKSKLSRNSLVLEKERVYERGRNLQSVTALRILIDHRPWSQNSTSVAGRLQKETAQSTLFMD